MCVGKASAKLHDTKTGNKVDQPILLVAFPRETCGAVKWETVDPSDAMKNFVHRMTFKRFVGFEPIDPLRIADLQK